MLLLVGGNGFLGVHIAHVAVRQGIEVGVAGTSYVAAAGLPESVHYTTVGDPNYDEFIGFAKTIVYLANASRPSQEKDALRHEVQANISAVTQFILKLSKRNFEGQVIYASSGGQVYGRRYPVPALETDPLKPCTAYGLGKLMCEEILGYGHRVFGLNTAVLRIANPVGVGQIGTGHGLVGAVFRALREDTPLSLFGDGNNVRDYFPADDLGRLVSLLYKKNWRGEGVYNIGSGVGATELDVIDAVHNTLGKSPQVIHKPAREFDLPYAVVNAQKASEELGWVVSEDLPMIIRSLASDSLSKIHKKSF